MDKEIIMSKIDILTQAFEHRNQEILEYQINIDNYTLAIAKISKEYTGASPIDVAMIEFRSHLENMLQTSLIEQRKSIIIRDVVKEQLGIL